MPGANGGVAAAAVQKAVGAGLWRVFGKDKAPLGTRGAATPTARFEAPRMISWAMISCLGSSGALVMRAMGFLFRLLAM
jgi:hypothetical protein